MPRALKIFLAIVLVLVVFTLGKWLIIDSLLDGKQSGRYRNPDSGAQAAKHDGTTQLNPSQAPGAPG